MNDSLKPSRTSSKKENKPDPFAVADLDSLADEILTEIERPEIDRDKLRRLGVQMKSAANSVTLFILQTAEETDAELALS